TLGTHYFGAAHAMGVIVFGADVALVDRLIETRPTASRIVLGIGGKQRRTAHRAVISACRLGIPILASESPFSPLLPHDAKCILAQLLAQLFVRTEGVVFVCHDQLLAGPLSR